MYNFYHYETKNHKGKACCIVGKWSLSGKNTGSIQEVSKYLLLRFLLRMLVFLPLFLLLLHFMEVNDQLIDKLAHLARLTFSEAEKTGIKEDLQKMISFIEKLNQIDTTNVEPQMFMSNEINVFRADEVKGSISREKGLLNAPLKDDAFFKVPKVIRK